MTEICTLLTHWKNKGFIDPSLYKKLYISDGDLPRSYGLLKVHKEGNPLRMLAALIVLFSIWLVFLRMLLIKVLKKILVTLKTISISLKKSMICLCRMITNCILRYYFYVLEYSDFFPRASHVFEC